MPNVKSPLFDGFRAIIGEVAEHYLFSSASNDAGIMGALEIEFI